MKKRLYNIEKQDHYVCIKFDGGVVIGPQLIMEAVGRLNSLFRIERRCDLWDFRGCIPDPNFGYDAMARIVDDIKFRIGDNWAEKSALLVDDAIQYGLSRMFQILAEGYRTRISVFQNETEARQWISREVNSEVQGS